jgi:hypothetical protein
MSEQDTHPHEEIDEPPAPDPEEKDPRRPDEDPEAD